MATFGSSVINKSGKKFAPKAPVRRAAAPISTATSVGPSAEKQNLSETTQPRIQQQVQGEGQPQAEEFQAQIQTQFQPQAKSDLQKHVSCSVSATIPATTQVPPPPSTSATNSTPLYLTDVPTPISRPTPPVSLPTTAASSSTPPIIPQKRLAESREPLTAQKQGQAATAKEQNAIPVETQPARTEHTPRDTDSPSQLLEPLSSQPASLTIDPVAYTQSPPPSIIASSSQATPPAAKRRRIQASHPDDALVHASGQSDFSVQVAIGASNGSVANLSDNAEADSSNTNPVANQPPPKARKPRLSEKARGKQPMERVAAQIVTDAVRGSSSGALRIRKPKKLINKEQQSTVGGVATNTVVLSGQGSSAKGKAKRGRKVRESTPEGADEVKIVPSKVRMSDLCVNTRTGKKSTREKEFEELDKAEAIRQSQQQLQEVLGPVENPSETAESRLERLSRAGEEGAQVVPNTIIVNGEIQIDESSLQIDRHANAAVDRDAEQLEGIDESELTRRVNSASWLKRGPRGQWDEESTERFFEALRMFGTDFGMISKLFPDRTRRSIKLKFRKEEKTDRQRIKQTLMGERILVDMEEYSRISNTVYGDPKELERDLAEDRKRMEEEQAAAKEALDEVARQREREVEAERAAADEEFLAKGNGTMGEVGGGAKGRRGGKSKVGKKPGRMKNKGVRPGQEEGVDQGGGGGGGGGET